MRIELSPYFDAESPWLAGPVRCLGYCIDGEDLAAERFAWIDFRAPLVSGAAVTVLLETEKLGVVLAGKILEFTRDGRPWLVCYGTRDHSQVVAVPLDHPKLRVLAIGATVAELYVARQGTRATIPEDTIWQHLQHVGAPALREWRKHGLPRRQSLRAVNYRSSVDLVRSLTVPLPVALTAAPPAFRQEFPCLL